MGRPILRLAAVPGVLAALLIAVPGAAQDQSVAPGINRSYTDPDVDRLVGSLERDERAIYRFRHAIVAALAIDAGMDIADVGAGTGFLTIMMARETGPDGTVHAVDIARELLDHIEEAAAAVGVSNIKTVLGDQHTTNLAADSVDLALISDVYHHFEFPEDSMASIHRALRDDGRLVIIDFERIVGVSADFQLNHVRAGKGTVTDEVKNAGFDLVKEIPLIDGQYFLVFEKRGA